MDKLLTKKDLAERWQVTTKTVENWIKDGVLTPCSKIPGNVRFTEQYIAELEGTKIEKFSPLEKKRLEKELEEWKAKAINAENALAKINMVLAEIMYSKSKKAC